MPRSSFARLLTLLPAMALICAAVPALAQPASTASGLRGEPVVPEKAGKEIRALYVGDTPPRIDGRLDDEIWLTAPAATGFTQRDPEEGKPTAHHGIIPGH